MRRSAAHFLNEELRDKLSESLRNWQNHSNFVVLPAGGIEQVLRFDKPWRTRYAVILLLSSVESRAASSGTVRIPLQGQVLLSRRGLGSDSGIVFVGGE